MCLPEQIRLAQRVAPFAQRMLIVGDLQPADGDGAFETFPRQLTRGDQRWPKVQDGVMRLSRAQFEALFEGLDWRRVIAQRVLPPTAAG